MSNASILITRQPDQIIETKGRFHVDTGIQTLYDCLSLELPWKKNEHQISCIPAGTYQWKKVPASHIPYEHIAIIDVPAREGVCIHCGNFAAGKKVDVLGCIMVGTSYADINADGIEDITSSRVAFDKIMALLPDSGKLIII